MLKCLSGISALTQQAGVFLAPSLIFMGENGYLKSV